MHIKIGCVSPQKSRIRLYRYNYCYGRVKGILHTLNVVGVVFWESWSINAQWYIFISSQGDQQK